MSKHHACTEQGCKRVCNAFSCNVLADMSGTLLKDGYIVSHICTCNKGIAVALIASCIRTLRLEFANAVSSVTVLCQCLLPCKLPLRVLSLSLHYCEDITTPLLHVQLLHVQLVHVHISIPIHIPGKPPHRLGTHPGLLLKQHSTGSANMQWLCSRAETRFVYTLAPLKGTVEQPSQTS